MKNLLTAFQREFYKFMTLHLYGSVIIHSHYVQKCDFNTSAEHKKYHKKMLVTVLLTIDFHWMVKHTKTSSSCMLHSKRNVLQFWKEMRVSKKMTIFKFGHLSNPKTRQKYT